MGKIWAERRRRDLIRSEKPTYSWSQGSEFFYFMALWSCLPCTPMSMLHLVATDIFLFIFSKKKDIFLFIHPCYTSTKEDPLF
ncbi:hypothetical protein PVAP13_9NG371414 [Panicum virgatum]|uniref:Uncharacterized protein n=1 Tax=Panicum virgatum TaxID=38727 RepID=A0A8T0MNB6_PANVG|nr:hypothetical protein PVAP13_9NG371414 [Panicum virgatum]